MISDLIGVVLIEIDSCAMEAVRVIGMDERYVVRNKLQKGRFGAFMIRSVSDFNGVVSGAEQLNKENPEL